MMRGNLEAHLMYCTPSELLVADPVSKASRRLLGSFSQAIQGLKAESVPGAKYEQEEARKAILDFYAAGGSPLDKSRGFGCTCAGEEMLYKALESWSTLQLSFE